MMYSVSAHRLRTDAQLMGNNTLHARLAELLMRALLAEHWGGLKGLKEQLV